MKSSKRNLETLDKAYRVRFLRDNFSTIAFIVLISVLFICFLTLFLINFNSIANSKINIGTSFL